MTDGVKDNDLENAVAEVAERIADVLKPYVAPSIVSEALFVRTAGCGKSTPTQFGCGRIPRAS